MQPTTRQIVQTVGIVGLFAAAMMFAPPAKPAEVNEQEAQTLSRDLTITVEQATNIGAALRQLDKYERAGKDGKTETAWYTFSSDVRFVIAVDIDVAQRVTAQLQMANNKIVQQFAGGGSKVPDDKMGAYNVELRKVLDASCRCTFTRIKRGDLNLDKNPIPPSVLALLLPIVDQ